MMFLLCIFLCQIILDDLGKKAAAKMTPKPRHSTSVRRDVLTAHLSTEDAMHRSRQGVLRHHHFLGEIIRGLPMHLQIARHWLNKNLKLLLSCNNKGFEHGTAAGMHSGGYFPASACDGTSACHEYFSGKQDTRREDER
jgi:hypothetical protein